MIVTATELQRARWWREGWRRKYVHAFDADRMTDKIDVRDIAACLRWVAANERQKKGHHEPITK